MSYWVYVMDAVMHEDRSAVERRHQRRVRLKRQREDAVLAEAARVVAHVGRRRTDAVASAVHCSRAAGLAGSH